MLHMEFLLLIYHFARFGAGNMVEIGLYIGGSVIAAAPHISITIEAGVDISDCRAETSSGI
jgi:hypothetical protein